jgi:hypothetical protein
MHETQTHMMTYKRQQYHANQEARAPRRATCRLPSFTTPDAVAADAMSASIEQRYITTCHPMRPNASRTANRWQICRPWLFLFFLFFPFLSSRSAETKKSEATKPNWSS